MVSAHWNHFHIIQYLIEQLNVNPNEQSDNDRTALHNAVESNSIEIVQYLLEKRVQLTKDTQTNLTSLLLLSAKNLNFNIMNLFKNSSSNFEWIQVNELVGAIYSSQQSNNYNLDKVYQYLYQAKIILKNSNEIFSFEEEKEFESVEQLKDIYLNRNPFHIQSLLILEPILGLNNNDYYYSLRYYGATLIDSNQFYKGFQIWIYQLNILFILIIHKYLEDFFIYLIKLNKNHQINYLFNQFLFQIIYLTYKQIKKQD